MSQRREVVEVAHRFGGTVANYRYETRHAAINALPGDIVSIVFTDGTDARGPVLGVMFAPGAVVVRRPVGKRGKR